MMSTESQDEDFPEESRGLRRLAPSYRQRRYRAHAVLALLLIVGLTIITLRTDNVISRSTSMKRVSLDDALGAISPFAKKKVKLIQ
jgi:hypothetical protein